MPFLAARFVQCSLLAPALFTHECSVLFGTGVVRVKGLVCPAVVTVALVSQFASLSDEMSLAAAAGEARLALEQMLESAKTKADHDWEELLSKPGLFLG